MRRVRSYMKEYKIDSLVDTFANLVKEFTDSRKDTIFCDIIPIYIKGEQERGLKEVIGRVYFHQFILEFAYIITSGVIGPKSILECRIQFSKSDNLIKCSLYDIMHLLDDKDFKCYIFPYIESRDRMQLCFNTLRRALDAYLPGIKQIADDDSRKEQVISMIKSQINEFYNEDIFETESDDYFQGLVEFRVGSYHNWVRLRMCSNAYLNYLKGNYKKAVRQYKNYKNKTIYEQRLLDFIISLPEGTEYRAVDESQNTLRDGLREEKAMSVFLPVFVSWIVLTPILFAISLGFYYLLYFIKYNNSIYTTSCELYNAAFVFMPALLISIMLSYYTRKTAIKLIYRRKAEKLLQYDSIFNMKSENRFINKLAKLVVACSAIFIFLTVNWNISFYNNGFYDNSKYFKLQGAFIPYDSIDSVWLIKGRYNGFNEWLDNPSYVLLLKTGRTLDLYDYVEHADAEKKIYPVFIDKKLNIKTGKSIDDVHHDDKIVLFLNKKIMNKRMVKFIR